MIYGTVYVLCLPQASKVNIWTLARFNEQNFSEISLPSRIQWEISLASLKHCAVCLLGLAGLRRLKDKHTHAHTHTPSAQRQTPFSCSPGGTDDSHYRLKARWPRWPYSAALLSYQTALLYWCSIISFPLSFGVHQGVAALGGRGGRSLREKVQLCGEC